MENKKNYSIKLNDLDSEYIINTFYNNLVSTNIITINDINYLRDNINFCIDMLSSICTDEFCQLCENTYEYYIKITDDVFPRVKYFNNITNSISAVFSDSVINDTFYLSSTPKIPINLLTYSDNKVFKIVKSINGQTGNITGIEKITINGKNFQWNSSNNGKINLGYFKIFDNDYLISINNKSGNLTLPYGITYNGRDYICDQNGLVKLPNIFDKYITVSEPIFNKLYIKSINENNVNSVINLQYIKDNNIPLHIKSKDIYIEEVNNNISGSTSYSLIDGNFLSFIYGIQNGEIKRIKQYKKNNGNENVFYSKNYYQKGIPLTFIPFSDGTLTLQKNNSPDNINLSYSINYSIYKEFTGSLEFKKRDVIALTGDNNHFSKTENDYYYFTVNNGGTKIDFACYGNIMSLVNWDTNIRNNWQFCALFSGTNINKAPQLPATELKEWCYDRLFQGCSQLVVPPNLPANILCANCYRDMFAGCTSLSSVPFLPAIELAPSCYMQMFAFCTSLTILPYYLLPATTLKPWCYTGMFWGCQNLTDGPLLPASIPNYNSNGECDPNYTNCYGNIFSNCPNLTAAHFNCDPALLIQHNAPPSVEYPNGSTSLHEEEAKTWMMNYKNTNGVPAARAWLQSHNYANEWNNNWIEGSSIEGDPTSQPHNYPITLYNTMLWQQVKDDTTNNGVEKFYYDYNWTSFNYYWIKKIARSLQDTPLSFELISGVTDGAFCWRAQQYNLASNAITKYTYKNNKNYVNNMNAKYKYYNPTTKEISGSGRDANGWITPTWDWVSDPNGYTLIHGNFKFNNTTKGKNGLIISLSTNYFSQGLDEVNNRIIFWRLCHQNDCKFKILGNLNSLNGFHDNLQPYEFFSLFSDMQQGSKHHSYGFIDAHQMILPFKNLADHCYEKMFDGCSGLINGPTNLPATTLENQCYTDMFSGCTSLTNMPYISVDTFKEKSCMYMFSQCSSLVYATPFNNLQNTSLSCCRYMFNQCSNLQYFPDLVVNTIQQRSYSAMFQNCSSLLYPPSIEGQILKSYGCVYTFLNNKNLKYIPALTVNTINEGSLYGTFKQCKMIKRAYLYFNDLTLSSCYNMFNGCNNLCHLVVKFTNWKEDINATYNWLNNCSSTGTLYCSNSLNTTIRDYHHIPSTWEVKNNSELSILVCSDTISVGNMKIFYLTK